MPSGENDVPTEDGDILSKTVSSILTTFRQNPTYCHAIVSKLGSIQRIYDRIKTTTNVDNKVYETMALDVLFKRVGAAASDPVVQRVKTYAFQGLPLDLISDTFAQDSAMTVMTPGGQALATVQFQSLVDILSTGVTYNIAGIHDAIQQTYDLFFHAFGHDDMTAQSNAKKYEEKFKTPLSILKLQCKRMHEIIETIENERNGVAGVAADAEPSVTVDHEIVYDIVDNTKRLSDTNKRLKACKKRSDPAVSPTLSKRRRSSPVISKFFGGNKIQ